MAEVYEVANKYPLKYNEVFDRLQLDWGEKAFHRILQAHRNPTTGGCRPWAESEE